MGGRDETLDVVPEIHDHPFFLHPSDRTFRLDPSGKALRNLGPGIVGKLFDPQGNPLGFCIDVQYQHLDLVTFLDDFRRVLDPSCPTEIRDMHQAVDSRLDFDECTEGCEIAHHTRQLRAGRVLGGKSEPRILFDLFHAERDFLVLHVYFQHDRFDLVADIHQLGRMPNVARPRHLGNVDETLDSLLQFDERAVVGDRHDFSAYSRAHGVFLVDVGPWVRQKLLEPQRNTLAVPVDVENFYIEQGPDVHDLRGMSHPPPRHVGDMKQAVESTQVDERTEVGDVLDHTFPDLSDQELLDQRLALFLALSLEDDTPGNDDITATLVELDDLELERLAEQVIDVRHPAQRDLRTWQKRVHAHDVHCDAAFDLARQHSFNGLISLMGLANFLPNTQEVGFLLGEHDDSVIVFEALEKNFDLLARFNRVTVLELVERDRALALEAEFQDDHALGDSEHFRVDDLAFPEVAHHIRVIREQCLEVGCGYVEDLLAVRIGQQFRGDAARSWFSHGDCRWSRRHRGFLVRRLAGSLVVTTT